MMKKLFEKEKTKKKEAGKEAVAHGQDTKNARGIIGGSFRGNRLCRTIWLSGGAANFACFLPRFLANNGAAFPATHQTGKAENGKMTCATQQPML